MVSYYDQHSRAECLGANERNERKRARAGSLGGSQWWCGSFRRESGWPHKKRSGGEKEIPLVVDSPTRFVVHVFNVAMINGSVRVYIVRRCRSYLNYAGYLLNEWLQAHWEGAHLYRSGRSEFASFYSHLSDDSHTYIHLTVVGMICKSHPPETTPHLSPLADLTPMPVVLTPLPPGREGPTSWPPETTPDAKQSLLANCRPDLSAADGHREQSPSRVIDASIRAPLAPS